VNIDLMFSSETDDWATPQDFFDELHKEFNFTLDPCADKHNAKCEKFYTKDDGGVTRDWGVERVYMNPPYGKFTGVWMKKAYESSLKGALVVCLVPARTDTEWFHEFALKGEVRFIKGRLKFGGQKDAAPFPSIIVIFRPKGGEE
jgi:phage N-6-adenine-methyltransferase